MKKADGCQGFIQGGGKLGFPAQGPGFPLKSLSILILLIDKSIVRPNLKFFSGGGMPPIPH